MKKRILLADEDDSVRKMLARVLESAGYAVSLAASAEAAVLEARTGQLDLVLLDLMLPEQAGWEAFESIRRSSPAMPVIMMTAWPNQYEQAVQRGIDALMEKPLDLPLLLDHIRNLLAESQPQRAQRLIQRVALGFR